MRLAPIAAAVSTLVAGVFWAAPARAAATADIQILFTTLVARGAAVDVAFAVDCPAGYAGSTTVSLAQVHDGLVSSGTAVTALNCTGTGLLYLQRVTAGITGAPFAKGRATLAMQAVGCDDVDCFGTPLNQSVKITK